MDLNDENRRIPCFRSFHRNAICREFFLQNHLQNLTFITFLSHSITFSEICPLSMIFQQKYSRIGSKNKIFRLFFLKIKINY